MGQSYRDLIAWKKSRWFVSQVYRATEGFPRHELYGLTSQLRRAAVSVPSNIAEGQAHYSAREFHRFLSHARGSLVEIETQIMIALDLAYLRRDQAESLLLKAAELGRILNGLIRSTNSDTKPLQMHT